MATPASNITIKERLVGEDVSQVFSNLKVCVNGLPEDLGVQRTSVAQLIVKYGGTTSETVDRSVDYLVATSSALNTDIVRQALHYGTWVVSEEFFSKSVETGQLADAAKHTFDSVAHVYRMEDLFFAAAATPIAENLNAIQTYYSDEMKSKDIANELSRKAGTRLINIIYSVVGQKTASKVRPELTENAKAALSLFTYMVREDVGFQDAVERESVSSITKRLKLERHVEDSDPEHRRLAVSLIVFLSTNYPRFENLKLYLAPDVRASVDVTSVDLPRESFDVTVPRLSADGHIQPEGTALYYDLTFEEVATLMKVKDVSQGLTQEEADQRTDVYGFNELPRIPPPPWYKILFNQFKDFLVIIILVAAAVSLGLQEWVDGGVLAAVIVINVLIGFVQEMKAEKALDALQSLVVDEATVMRDGKQQQLPARVLVPGDIVILGEGSNVPADIRLFEAQSLRVIEAALTGESEPIKKITAPLRGANLAKGDQKNMCFMSTTVNGGDARGIVIATGKKTAVGKISKDIGSAENKPTKLQIKLKKMGIVLVIVAAILCSIVIGVSFGWLASRHPDGWEPIETEEIIKTGVSLAVSVIPEGLVAIVTITMAAGTTRMAAQNAIIRRLPAVETLGSITTICSDKTGTLTVGQMKTETVWCANGKSYSISGVGIDPEGAFKDDDTGVDVDPNNMSETLRHLLLSCSLCNGSSISKNSETNRWEYTGDPTEVALLVAAYKLNLGLPDLLKNQGWSKFGQAPFDSDRKRMTVLCKHSTFVEGTGVAYAKGAPETILKVSTHTVDENGEVVPLAEEHIAQIEEVSGNLASQGLRVLALAYRNIDDTSLYSEEEDNAIQFESELIFVGLAGMIDPPRAPVKQAVATCKSAGIRVVMITGDHPRTAYAIAQKLGIAEYADISNRGAMNAVKGSELAAMTKEQLASMDPFPTVFARVSPEDKMRIIHALQYNKEVVSMTGDGVNDAPAIKHADVGVAMGITGTDLTKQSADIILSDDNFTSIITAVREGRRIYDNIQKFIMYLLSCNSSEIWVLLIAACAGIPSPFSPIMILWANLIIDGPPALALGVDPAAPDILERKPRNPDSGVISKRGLGVVIFQGFTMALISLMQFCLTYYVEDLGPDAVILTHLRRARAVAFIQLASGHLVQSFLSRSTTRSLFHQSIVSNKYLIAGNILSLILLILGMYVPGMNDLFEQYPMEWYDWMKILGGVSIQIFMIEAYKLALRRGMCAPKHAEGEHVLFFDSV